MSLKKFVARNKLVTCFIIILIIGFGYYFFLHIHPRTDNAFVVANVRPVSAFVPGHITDIYVENNQKVKKGDKLLTVYKVPYELAVETLKSQLSASEFNTSALKEQIHKSKLNIKVNKAKYENAEYLSKQAVALYNTRAVSQKSAEQLTRNMDEAKAELDMAVSSLIINEELYKRSLANDKVLRSKLADANVNLSLTTIYAQSDGLISNMFVSVGTYANRGEALFSFIDTNKWWVQANLKETELSNVRKGQTVNVRLWLYPHHEIKGIVGNIGWNVDRQLTSAKTALPIVEKENEWFLLPQRFPVQIELLDHDFVKYPLHVGASATVIVNVSASEFTEMFWQFGLW